MRNLSSVLLMKKVVLAAALVILAVGCDKTPVEEGGYKVPSNAVNYSENGTANSYIVAPGSVAFISTEFKGNSTENRIEGIKDVKLVWQSEKDLVKELHYASSKNGMVAITGELSGNAVVAVVDDKDEVLWSWHLWITDYDPAVSLFETTSWKFMDRNLGAVSMEKGTFGKNAGLIYQWGRKDPFPSAVSFTEMNEDYTYTVDGEPTLYDINGAELPKVSSLAQTDGTIEKGIAHPEVFYKNVKIDTGEKDEYDQPIKVDNPRTGDWSDISDDDAWGGVSMKKSIYDPCPVGYKVPVCDAEGNTPYAWIKYAEREWDTEYNGLTQNGQWFPTIGTRVYASGGLDYTSAAPYSGMWIGTAGKASADLEANPTLYGQYMMITSAKRTLKVNKDRRSQGLSVRCVAE